MRRAIPTYDLYGEDNANRPNFRVHCETIASRSSGYQWEIGLHRHERFMQFLYIWSGSGDAILDGETVALKPPCVIFVPPGPTHGFRFSRDVAGLVITAFDEHRTSSIAARNAKVVFVDPADPETPYLHQTFLRIAEEYDGDRAGRHGLLDGYLAVIAGLVHRHDEDGPDKDAVDNAQRHVARLKELVARHFRQQIPASDYALRLGMSPTHLNRVVRKVTGMTAHDLIMSRSMDEAKQALALTGASVRHISENLGFSDAAYFSRCFRKHVGLSPKDYRRTQRAGTT